jgi:hypothetical protein
MSAVARSPCCVLLVAEVFARLPGAGVRCARRSNVACAARNPDDMHGSLAEAQARARQKAHRSAIWNKATSDSLLGGTGHSNVPLPERTKRRR